MTKSLDALIEGACNVEEAANEFSADRSNLSAGTYDRECTESFIAGAREVAERLVPALREAVTALEFLGDHLDKEQLGYHTYTKAAHEIRFILQKASDEWEISGGELPPPKT